MLFDRTKKVISILFPVFIFLLVFVVFGSFVLTASSSSDTSSVESAIPPMASNKIKDPHARTAVTTEDYLFFIVEGHELWRTDYDGTETSLVKASSGWIWELVDFTNAVLFTIYDSNPGQNGLWFSDGTESGTHIIKSFPDDNNYSAAWNIISADEVTYFFTIDNSNNKFGIWETDGTAIGTNLIHEFVETYNSFGPKMYLRSIDNTLFLSIPDDENGQELWVKNNLTNAITLVKDINPGSGSSDPEFLIDVNGLVYFSADDGIHGRELWVTDGTETGTFLLKDIQVGIETSNPQKLERTEERLFFAANDGEHGYELWVSNGTITGTHMVKDIYPGASSFREYEYYTFEGGNEVVIGETLFFFAENDIYGLELWVSDGTLSGTSPIKDVFPGINSGVRFSRNPLRPNIGRVQNLVFFEADDGIHGRECWRSDGTVTGTFMVKDVNPNGSAGCQKLHTFNDVYLFAANDGNASQVWATRGAFTETIKIAEHPGDNYLTPYPAPSNIEVLGFYGETEWQGPDTFYGGDLWALRRTDIERLFLPTVLNQVDALKVPGEIIFISDRDAGQYQVFNMTDLHTKALRRVTEDAYTYGDPSCSSDGRIVVNAGLGNRDGIYLLDYTTGIPTRVGDDNLVGEEPVWSPDNTRFAFSREGNLFTIGVDGTNLQQLTATTAYDIDPDWSPDGSQLAFASDRSGTLQLYVMDVASQQSQALLPNWHNVKEPAWSLDGKQIAFYSDADGDNEIYVLQLETGAVAQLTDNNAHDRTPLWSPDGQWILFTSERDGNNEFYVTTPTGDKVTRLTDDPSFDWGGCWYQQP